MDWTGWLSSAFGFFQSTITGNIAGFVSIFLGIYAIYITLRRGSVLAFGIKGVRLLGSLHSSFPAEVSVMYKGQAIPRLTRSSLVIWNRGKNTIKGSDIVGSDPLRIEMEGDGRILSAEVVASSRTVVGAECEVSEQQALLKFVFLDANDGFVIEVLHTSEDFRLPLMGTIQGLPEGFKNVGRLLTAQSRTAGIAFGSATISIPRGVLVGTTLVFGILMVAGAAFLPAEPLHTLVDERSDRAPLWVAGLAYIVLSLLMLWRLRRKYPRSLQTESLD